MRSVSCVRAGIRVLVQVKNHVAHRNHDAYAVLLDHETRAPLMTAVTFAVAVPRLPKLLPQTCLRSNMHINAAFMINKKDA